MTAGLVSDSEKLSEANVSADATAVQLALNAVGHGEDARTFLKEQTRLVRRQTHLFELEEKLHHWSLRFRHANELLSLTFRIATAALAVMVVGILAAMIWTASQDQSLVVQSFSVPPDLTNSGLNGQTIAGMLLDKLQDMQTQSAGIRANASFKNDWTDTAKIEIPEVGLSLDQLTRYLRSTFGNPTFVSGEVFHNTGGLAVNLRLGSSAGQSFAGSNADLNQTLQKSAEFIYGQLQPGRYITYLQNQNRIPEAIVVAESVAQRGDFAERPWAYVALERLRFDLGDLKGGEAAAQAAIALNPNLTWTYQSLSRGERLFGYEEIALAAIKRARELVRQGAPELTPAAKALVFSGAFENELSDYLGASVATQNYARTAGTTPAVSQAFVALLAYYDVQIHDLAAAQSLLRGVLHDSDALTNLKQYNLYTGSNAILDLARGDSRAAIREFEDTEPELVKQGPIGLALRDTTLRPFLAYALARSGDFSEAQQLIEQTPPDCYRCIWLRAQIAALAHDDAAAERWFKEAVRQGPSLPLAYSLWGQWQLSRGNIDAAIKNFDLAHKKGPNFADPLELWGEALMLRNRSDLALSKFEEASRHAPNWGRLHMKWGEALSYVGHKDEADAQYRIASTLYLSVTDKAELERDMRG